MNTNLVQSALATHQHMSRSDRYGFVPTTDLIEKMGQHGWQVVSASEARCRDRSRVGFNKHLLRFRNPSLPAVTDAVPELLLLNSHDGSSTYQMRAGFYRFVCMNGLVVGEDIFPTFRVRHGKDALKDVIEGTYEIMDRVPEIVGQIGDMRAISLTDGERLAFARAALPLRFGHSPITEEQALQTHRNADNGHDLWSTFNVVQENLIKGGQRGHDAQGRRRRTRAVNGIDGNVKLNSALWTLAEEMRKLKAA